MGIKHNMIGQQTFNLDCALGKDLGPPPSTEMILVYNMP